MTDLRPPPIKTLEGLPKMFLGWLRDLADKVATKEYVDDLVEWLGQVILAYHAYCILKDGTEAFTGNQSMGGYKLTNLGTPTSDSDAATKKYVDDYLTWLGGIITSYHNPADDFSWVNAEGDTVTVTNGSVTDVS